MRRANQARRLYPASLCTAVQSQSSDNHHCGVLSHQKCANVHIVFRHVGCANSHRATSSTPPSGAIIRETEGIHDVLTRLDSRPRHHRYKIKKRASSDDQASFKSRGRLYEGNVRSRGPELNTGSQLVHLLRTGASPAIRAIPPAELPTCTAAGRPRAPARLSLGTRMFHASL